MRELVLLLEDDPRLAAFLDRELAQAGYRVAQRTNGSLPDVIVASGLHRLDETRQLPSVPVLLLSTGVEERIQALEAGADDVLASPCHPDELVARVRALLRRKQATATQSRSGVLRYADVELNQDTYQISRAGRRIMLRNRGYELLAYLLRHPERVVRRQELLQHVWGWPSDDGGSNVVEVTIGHVRKALGEPRLIHTVRPVGYILKS